MTEGEDHAPSERLEMAVFSVSFDGNAFYVRKLQTGVVLEHTLCAPYKGKLFFFFMTSKAKPQYTKTG